MKKGDWVKQCSAGIWQIDRIVPEHYETRFSLDASKTLSDITELIVKRLVNNKWKRAFAMESVDASLVKPLNKAEQKRLATYIKNHESELAEFTAFEEPVPSVLNLGFSLPRTSAFKAFARDCERLFRDPLAKGMTSDAILRVIAKSEFASWIGGRPTEATLQFVNIDHELRRKDFIYREMNVLDF